jgi:hypothetical protein
MPAILKEYQCRCGALVRLQNTVATYGRMQRWTHCDKDTGEEVPPGSCGIAVTIEPCAEEGDF